MFGRLRLRRVSIAIVFVALALIMTMGTVFARNGPPPGKGPGAGETVANNLSVPTMFVGSVGFGLPDVAADTWTALEVPTGTATSNWPIDPAAYYYVQGVNVWRAQYEKTATATVTGKWGDNLSGSASLKAGHPVRVEMGLTYTDATLLKQGYTVIKLEPSVEDRNSSYGTLAGSATGPAYPQNMVPRVWTTGATLTINGGTPIVLPGEINATGAPVFGYNWRPAAAGDYTLTFHVPSTSGVTISNSNTGDPYSISIDVTVTGGGGGGRGGGPPNP